MAGNGPWGKPGRRAGSGGAGSLALVGRVGSVGASVGIFDTQPTAEALGEFGPALGSGFGGGVMTGKGRGPWARWSVRPKSRSRGFAAAFWIFLAGAGASFWAGGPRGPQPEERLRRGLELIEQGRLDAAKAEILAAAEGGDSTVAGAAYHDLGVLALQEATDGGGYQEAIRFTEAAVLLMPGSPEAAWNLEMALRGADQQATNAPGGGPGGRDDSPAPSPTQQEPSASADTMGKPSSGLGPGEPREQGAGSRMTEEEARRVLASFRLMEKEGSLEALRSLLAEGRGTGPLSRKGPPW